jgi:Protein of unknown function (DUF3500)
MTSGVAGGDDGPTLVAMAEAACRLLDVLDDEQRDRACYPFPADAERRSWFYLPTDHGGLSLLDCRPGQRRAVLRLVATGLSPAGYAQVAAATMGHELILERLEQFPALPVCERPRDSLGYSVSIFGNPLAAPWAWRFGGHHLSLNYTVGAGAASSTPSFLGVDPAESALPGGATLRPAGALEDLGRELVRSLSPAQLTVAVLADCAPPDIVTGNRPTLDPPQWVAAASELWRDPARFPGEAFLAGLERTRAATESLISDEAKEALSWTGGPAGIVATQLTAGQREILHALVSAYLDRLPDDVAQVEAGRVLGAAADQLHFAWAGGTEPRQGHYYRVHGPRLLIEYDNTQRDANHIHTVWRDPLADFGADLLAEHYARHHRPFPQADRAWSPSTQ